MTRVILIRHGHSLANHQRIFAGHLDFDLHESGISQAKDTAKYVYEHYNVDKIYSSDLSRAYNTAKELAVLTNLEIETDVNFRELFVGDFEGKTFKEFEENYPEDILIWRNDIDNIDFKRFGGEYISELQERFYNAVLKVTEENDGKTIAIASHATAIRTFIAKVKGVSVQEADWPANASVTVAEYEDGVFTLKLIGYNEHLNNFVKPSSDGV